jgi:hypothetical protein
MERPAARSQRTISELTGLDLVAEPGYRFDACVFAPLDVQQAPGVRHDAAMELTIAKLEKCYGERLRSVDGAPQCGETRPHGLDRRRVLNVGIGALITRQIQLPLLL